MKKRITQRSNTEEEKIEKSKGQKATDKRTKHRGASNSETEAHRKPPEAQKSELTLYMNTRRGKCATDLSL